MTTRPPRNWNGNRRPIGKTRPVHRRCIVCHRPVLPMKTTHIYNYWDGSWAIAHTRCLDVPEDDLPPEYHHL